MIEHPEYDPVLPPKEAALYIGRKHPKTLIRLNVERTQLPGTGTKRPAFGYRLSVLNRLLDEIADPKCRKHAARKSA